MMPESRGVTLKLLSLTSDKVDEEHDEANALKYAISTFSFFFHLHSHSSHSFHFWSTCRARRWNVQTLSHREWKLNGYPLVYLQYAIGVVKRCDEASPPAWLELLHSQTVGNSRGRKS